MENDLISRQAVLELVEGWWLGHTKEDDLATEIKELPSADNNWLKCIEDIKAEIEERKGIAVRAMFDSHYSLKEQTRGLINGYDSALKTIDRHVNELRGEADESAD